MAWNRPSENKMEVKGGGGQRNVHFKGLAAVVSVVLVAAGAAWWLWMNDKSEDESPPPQAVRQISEVKPAPAPKSVAKKSVQEKEETPEEDEGIYTDEKGVRRYPGGQRVWDPKGHTTPRVHGPKRIFEHVSENMIADLIQVPLGAQFFGNIDYDSQFFRDDFAAALVDKIQFTDEDTDEDRKLKETMISLKEELRQRIKGGEDISQILTDARAEMQRVGQYKTELEKMIQESIEDDGIKDEDLNDYVDAANKMLADKGLAPLSMNPVAMRNIINQLKELQPEENEE